MGAQHCPESSYDLDMKLGACLDGNLNQSYFLNIVLNGLNELFQADIIF